MRTPCSATGPVSTNLRNTLSSNACSVAHTHEEGSAAPTNAASVRKGSYAFPCKTVERRINVHGRAGLNHRCCDWRRCRLPAIVATFITIVAITAVVSSASASQSAEHAAPTRLLRNPETVHIPVYGTS